MAVVLSEKMQAFETGLKVNQGIAFSQNLGDIIYMYPMRVLGHIAL